MTIAITSESAAPARRRGAEPGRAGVSETALRSDDLPPLPFPDSVPGARQSIEFLVRQTVDVHHHDRAQHAGGFLPERPAPQRLSVIPSRAKVVLRL